MERGVTAQQGAAAMARSVGSMGGAGAAHSGGRPTMTFNHLPRHVQPHASRVVLNSKFPQGVSSGLEVSC